MNVDQLLTPEIVAFATLSLTEIARQLGVPTKYLPYTATLMGGVVGVILSLPETFTIQIDALLSGGLVGMLTTYAYSAIARKLEKK